MAGASVCTASKHAVEGLTQRAPHWNTPRKGIRVNAVAPAAIETDMIDLVLFENVFKVTQDLLGLLRCDEPCALLGWMHVSFIQFSCRLGIEPLVDAISALGASFLGALERPRFDRTLRYLSR